MNDYIYGNNNLRNWLLRRLAMKDRPKQFEAIWSELKNRNILSDEEAGDGYSDEDVYDAAITLREWGKKWQRVSSGNKVRTRGKQDILEIAVPDQNSIETLTQKALESHFATDAARQRCVKKYRSTCLPKGQLIHDEEGVLEFAASAINADRSQIDRVLDIYSVPDHGPITYDFDAQSFDSDQLSTRYDHVRGVLEYEREEFQRKILDDWNTGEFSPLILVSTFLFRYYPWQTFRDAVLFLVSGIQPSLPKAVSAALHEETNMFSITFAPWASERSVVNTYRHLMKSRKRTSSERTMRVLSFVSDQSDEEGNLPSWATLQELWNEAYSDEKFEKRDGIFKAYNRALQCYESMVDTYLHHHLGYFHQMETDARNLLDETD